MSEDLSTEIKIGADASGVEVGVGKAKRTLASLGQAAEQAGKAGGDGLLKIGAGGEASARSIDKATRNTIASLQRQIAAFEAGGTSSRQYQEQLARMRGLDTNALKPYLDQLDAAKAKAEAATRAQGGLKGAIDNVGDSSAIASRAMGVLGVALTAAFSGASIKAAADMADSLDDMAEKSGIAVRELSALRYAGEVVGTPLEALGTGIRKLGQNMAAAAGGAKEQAAAFAAVGVAVRSADGSLRSQDEVLGDLATKFAGYRDGAEKSALAIEIFGKQGEALIPLLNQGATGIALLRQEGENLGAVFGGDLAKQAADFNDNLTRISLSSEGARLALAGELLPTLNKLAAAFIEARDGSNSLATTLGSGVRTVVEAAVVLYSDVVFVLKGIGREIGAIGAQFAALGRLDFKGWSAISDAVREDGVRAREELDKFQRDVLSARYLTSKAGAGRGTAADPRSLGDTSVAAPIVTKPESAGPRDNSIKAEQSAYESLISTIRTKIETDKAELAGSVALTESQKIRIKLEEDLATGKLKLTDAHKQQALAALAELAAVERIAAESRAALKISQERQQFREKETSGIASFMAAQEAASASALASARDRTRSLQDEDAALRMSTTLNISLAEAVERVAIARLEEKQAGFYEGSEGYEALQKEIAARKELLGLISSNEANKEFVQDWKSSVEKYEDIFRKGFADMLNNGKAGWKSFTRSLVTTFKTAVADQIYKMFAQKFVVNIVGNLMGVLGGGGAAAAAGAAGVATAGGSALSGIGAIGSAISAGTSAFGIGASYGVQSLFANGLTGTLAAGGQMIGAGSIMSGLGTIVGALGPIALGIGALYTIWKKLDDSGTYHTGGAAQYSSATGLRSGQSGADFRIGFGRVEEGKEAISAVGNIAKGIGSALDAIAVSFGKKAGFEVATAFADDTSKDGAWGALRISKDGKDLLNWEDTRQSKWAPREFGDGEAGYKQYLAAVAKDTRQVLLDMDLPSWADTMLEALGDTADMDALTGVIQQISTVQTAFTSLGKIIEGFAGMTDKAFEAIMKASGGIEALSANAANFYNNYYSADERKAKAQQQLDSQFAELGIATPKNRDEFRRLVEQSLAEADVQAKNRESLVGNVSSSIAALGKGGVSAADLGKLGFSNIDPALLGGKADPKQQEKLRKFLDGVNGLGGKGLDDDAFRQGIAGLVEANAEILGIGDDAGKTAAALLGLSGAFAELNETAEQTQERLRKEQADARDKAFRALERAVAAERELLDARLQVAQELADSLSSLFDVLRDNVRDLYSEVDSTREMQAAQGRDFITQALATARASGYLPDADAISQAIDAARQGIDNGSYTTQFQRDRDALVLAGQLNELGGISELQLSEAERQIRAIKDQTDRLDQQLEEQRKLIDIANGTYEATVSVEQAIKDLQALMFPETNLKAPEKVPGSGFVIGGGGGGSGSGAPSKPGSGFIGAGGTEINDPATVGKLTSIRNYTNTLDFGAGNKIDSARELAAQANARGVSATEIAIANGYRVEDVERLFADAGVKVPRYAVGTNYVPNDGLAYLHEGEAVVPKAYNPAATPGLFGGSNDKVMAELAALRETMAALQAAAAATANNTRAMPQMAQQFDSYTNGGGFSRQKAMA